MRITTLIENHRHPNRNNLKAEHGLSFYIENDNRVFMSDVGKSGYFADNAADLKVDLSAVEGLAISHHHYDHGGGLGRFFEENQRGLVYLRSSPKIDYFIDVPSLPAKYVGLDKSLLAEMSQRVVLVQGNLEIGHGFHMLTDIPTRYPKPEGDQRLKMRRGHEERPDSFEHELVTVVEGNSGLAILTGCAHNGVLNMIAAVRRVWPETPIQAVIGGFHLLREDEKTVRQIGETLLAMAIPAVYTGHCTGENSTTILEDIMGNRLHRLHTGLVITI